MNIFRLDNEPALAARYHCDKHVVKMILETAQLLSTAHASGGVHTADMCRPSHMAHPCAVWARTASANYDWLYALGVHLCVNYRHRYKRVHAYERMFERALAWVPRGVPDATETPAPQCMPDQYKCEDAVEAYRHYYVGDKLRFAKWRYSESPPWLPK